MGAKAKKFTIGFVYMMVGVLIYLVPNAVYKMYYSADIPESANQPLLWTLFSTAFQLLFFFPVIVELVKKWKKPDQLQILKSEVRIYFCQSLQFSVYQLFSNYFYQKGFNMTRLISSDVLSSTQTIFTVVISTIPFVLKKRIPVDWFKFAMAYLATIGFILIFIEDYLFQSEEAGTELISGDGYSLGYSLIYAIYTVRLSEITEEVGEEKFRYNLFLGFMGLLNVVVMVPILFIFDVTGFEDLQIPDLNYTLIMIPQALAAILIVYCWAKAVGGLGANLAASTYTLTTLPFIIVLDFYFDDDIYGQITNMYIFGAFLVLSAFFTISVMELHEEVHILRLEKLQEKQE